MENGLPGWLKVKTVSHYAERYNSDAESSEFK